jgi:hypothetical protein
MLNPIKTDSKFNNSTMYIISDVTLSLIPDARNSGVLFDSF